MNGGTATGNQSGNTSTLKPVGTILEGAQLKGMRTGIVTTTRVTHATPASFSAHVADRDDENEIAREQVYSLELNVLLGGGGRGSGTVRLLVVPGKIPWTYSRSRGTGGTKSH